MNMGYFSSSHIEFSRVMHYNLFVAQTVHLVRFVPEHKYLIILGPYHAQGLENTTSVVYRHPSHSLRWHSTHSMFLQQAHKSANNSEFISDIFRDIFQFLGTYFYND